MQEKTVMEYEKILIKKKIRNAKIVSFDVFDTLIGRNTLEPQGVKN